MAEHPPFTHKTAPVVNRDPSSRNTKQWLGPNPDANRTNSWAWINNGFSFGMPGLRALAFTLADWMHRDFHRAAPQTVMRDQNSPDINRNPQPSIKFNMEAVHDGKPDNYENRKHRNPTEHVTCPRRPSYTGKLLRTFCTLELHAFRCCMGHLSWARGVRWAVYTSWATWTCRSQRMCQYMCQPFTPNRLPARSRGPDDKCANCAPISQRSGPTALAIQILTEFYWEKNSASYAGKGPSAPLSAQPCGRAKTSFLKIDRNATFVHTPTPRFFFCLFQPCHCLPT